MYKHEDVFNFFETVIEYYKALPTWRWLGAAASY